MYYDDAIDIDMFSTHLYHLYTQLLKYNTKREDKIKLQIRRTSDLSEIKYRIKKGIFPNKLNIKKNISIIENKLFDCVTDHTQPPFNKLTKDIYHHDWIINFMKEEGIPESSHALHNLLGYQFISHNTRVEGLSVRVKTLIKIEKYNIHTTLI